MDYKKFFANVYISGGKAFHSIGNKTIYEEKPFEVALNYVDQNADAILVFDMSTSEERKSGFEAIEEIVKACKGQIPVYVAGNINTNSDIKSLFNIGVDKCVINLTKNFSTKSVNDLIGEYSTDCIVGAINQKSQLEYYKDIIDSKIGELLLIRESSLSECIKAVTKPMIVPVADIPLDRLMDILEKDEVSGIMGAFVLSNISDICSIKSICLDRGIYTNAFISTLEWKDLKKDSNGLIPVVVQDYKTNEVLMVAYMNEEAYNHTIESGRMTYYSRSRKALWLKGETSGHYQFVHSLYADCDSDTILAKIYQIGAACHTGSRSCFFKKLVKREYRKDE